MKIKVVYTADKLNEMLDNHIRHMFETNNFHWYAQGYSVEKKERDMCFDVPNCFADKTKETVNSAAFVENGKAGKQQGQPAIPLSIVREVLEDKYDPMAELDIDELIDDMEEIAKRQA